MTRRRPFSFAVPSPWIAAGASVSIAWVIVDVTRSLRWLSKCSMTELILAVASLVLVAVTISAAMTCLGFVLFMAQALMQHVLQSRTNRWPWLNVLIPSVVAELLWILLVFDLTSGPSVSSYRYIVAIRIGVFVIGGCAIVLGACMIRRLAQSPLMMRSPARFCLIGVLLLLTVAIEALDRDAFVRQYPGFHVALAFVMFGCCAWIGVTIGFPGSRSTQLKAITSVAILSLLCGSLFGTGILPGSSPLLRSYLLVHASITSRFLRPLLPEQGTGSSTHFSQHRIESLSARARTPQDWLDVRFPSRRSFNVVLITVDTVRADRVGSYGYARGITPSIDALASSSIQFDHAYAQHPSSQLSMASMFKGLYPSATDVARKQAADGSVKGPFPDLTLAHRMRVAGWHTEAIVALSSNLLSRYFSYLPDGFESFHANPNDAALTADVVLDHAIDAIAGWGTRPEFLWIHFFDPHDPYSPHDRWRLGDSPSDLYDGEIAYVDHHVGMLIQFLEKRSDWNRTVVILHSDHGEEFLEHGGLRHHSSVYEEQVRVPFLIRLPGVDPAHVSSPVELVDIPETVCDLVGIDDSVRTHGQSLVSLALAAEAPGLVSSRPAPIAFVQLRAPQLHVGRLDGIRYANWKLILDIEAGVFELYDLSVDPYEQRDVYRQQPEETDEVRAWLAAARFLCSRSTSGAAEGIDFDASFDSIVALASRSSPSERLAILMRLGRRQQLDAMTRVATECLERDSDPAVLKYAASTVGIHSYAPAKRLLIRHLFSGIPQVRHAAAMALANFESSDVRTALATAGGSQENDLVFAIARGLSGDKGVQDVLFRRLPLLSGDNRLLTSLALSRLSKHPYESVATCSVESGTLPFRLDVAAIRCCARISSVRALHALYSRVADRPTSGYYAILILDSLSDHPINTIAPILRGLSTHEDPRVRARVAELLADSGRTSWLSIMRRAQESIVAAKGLARTTTGRQLVKDMLDKSLQRTWQSGVYDWGLALEYWRWLIENNKGTDARMVLESLQESTQDLSPLSREFLDLLCRLANRSSSPIIVELENGAAGPVSAPHDRAVVHLVKLSIKGRHGGLIGGRLSKSATLHLSLRNKVSGRIERLGPVQIPGPGVLSGAPILIPLRFEVSVEGGRRVNLVVTVKAGGSQEFRFKPLVIALQR